MITACSAVPHPEVNYPATVVPHPEDCAVHNIATRENIFFSELSRFIAPNEFYNAIA